MLSYAGTKLGIRKPELQPQLGLASGKSLHPGKSGLECPQV